MSDSTQPTIPMTSIVEFDNPRDYFDPAEQKELEESVGEHGILLPLVVRPVGEQDGVVLYALIAGERRYRAARACGLSEVPVVVRHVGKEVAFVLATVENTQRADMSATEEGAAAARELQAQNGDMEETRRRLGWSRTKLDQRLALMRCAPEVRKALNERRISLGHAELLAAVPLEKQISSLSKIIENNLTVAFVKNNLAKVAQSLTTAIFDQTECLTCDFNTACQRGLFAETISDGYCTNGACYDDKTRAVLATIKDELTNEYPVVRIVALGDTVLTVPLRPDGSGGVGVEQAQACKACENFGCTISALPLSVGQVERGLCFDAACNASKVAQHLREVESLNKPKNEAGKSQVKQTKGSGKKQQSKAQSKTTTVQTPQKVKDYRLKLWRSVAKKELFARLDDALSVLVALGITDSGRHISGSKMKEAFHKLTASQTPTDLPSVLRSMRANAGTRSSLLPALAASAMGDIQERDLVIILQFIGADLTKHWKLCAEFLALMTKSEIEVVADEVGLKSALGDRFKKVMDSKKDELIKGLLAVEGFDYTKAVPACIALPAAGPVSSESAETGIEMDGGADVDADDEATDAACETA